MLLVIDPAQEMATSKVTMIPADWPNSDFAAATATALLVLMVSQGRRI
jgi:hypothetical protein